MLHALAHAAAPFYACWAVVALLAVAAAVNHGWHHGRDHDPTQRLTREREQADADH
jgi:hypothetical protein